MYTPSPPPNNLLPPATQQTDTKKDDTGVINIISEHYIEAANAASINAPYGVSEFGLTGLHMADSTIVKAPRVQEAVFSVEGKLVETREFYSKAVPGKATTVLAIVEGVRFWAREDAINEDRNLLDPNVRDLPSTDTYVSYTD